MSPQLNNRKTANFFDDDDGDQDDDFTIEEESDSGKNKKKRKSVIPANQIPKTQKISRRHDTKAMQAQADAISMKANKSFRALRQAERDGDLERKRILMQQRKAEIERLAQIRRDNLRANEDLKLTREQLYSNVSQLII